MAFIRPLKPFRYSPPVGIERDYAVKLRRIVGDLGIIIKEEVINRLPDMLLSFKLESFRVDTVTEDLTEMFGLAWRRSLRSMRLNAAEAARFAYTKTNDWNKKKTGAMLRDKYGIDFFSTDPWLAAELDIFVTGNVNLVVSTNQKFLNETMETVFAGVKNGLRHEVIASEVYSMNKTALARNTPFRGAKYRASLIARDQVNKANGDMSRLRQTGAGIKKYVWRTVGDIRVRPLHSSYNGKQYTWKKGTPQGLHPGRDIQCRCYAEPVIT